MITDSTIKKLIEVIADVDNNENEPAWRELINRINLEGGTMDVQVWKLVNALYNQIGSGPAL